MALKFCDIGWNMLDDMFYGQYNGKQKHTADFEVRVFDMIHLVAVSPEI